MLEFMIAEAQRLEDSDFSLSKKELKAFFGRCHLRGVLKGRDELQTICRDKEYGRPVFPEDVATNKF